jgi:SAM-dependent methyltransferase
MASPTTAGGVPARPGQAPPGAAHWRRKSRQPPRKPIVPYVPTARSIVEAMLDLAAVGPGDVLYDLGCGDGRIVIGAAQRGARGVGVDVDRLRVREGTWNAKRAGVTDRARFLRQSLFDVDLRPASVVTLYLLPSVNRKLRPKLLRELRTGLRVVSNYFDMDDWQPDGRVEGWGRILYLWVVPAWMHGQWNCVLDHPDGRRHMTLRLSRQYQKVSGTVRVGRTEVSVEEGRLAGDRLTFWFNDKAAGVHLRCAGRVEGAQIRGTCHDLARPDAQSCAWGGRRHD